MLRGFFGRLVEQVILEIPQGIEELCVEALSGDICAEQIQ